MQHHSKSRITASTTASTTVGVEGTTAVVQPLNPSAESPALRPALLPELRLKWRHYGTLFRKPDNTAVVHIHPYSRPYSDYSPEASIVSQIRTAGRSAETAVLSPRVSRAKEGVVQVNSGPADSAAPLR